MLSQVLKQEDEPLELFQFLHDAIMDYDMQSENFMDFHLIFLLQLTRFLGIEPDSGTFVLKESGRPAESYANLAVFINQMLDNSARQITVLDRPSRNNLTQILVDYYRSHYDSIKPIRSIQVLNEVFR
jgi:DNA repair protein RecO (recombination protein O)